MTASSLSFSDYQGSTTAGQRKLSIYARTSLAVDRPVRLSVIEASASRWPEVVAVVDVFEDDPIDALNIDVPRLNRPSEQSKVGHCF